MPLFSTPVYLHFRRGLHSIFQRRLWTPLLFAFPLERFRVFEFEDGRHRVWALQFLFVLRFLLRQIALLHVVQAEVGIGVLGRARHFLYAAPVVFDVVHHHLVLRYCVFEEHHGEKIEPILARWRPIAPL